jgi:trehalose 6-phosphate phosphatase
MTWSSSTLPRHIFSVPAVETWCQIAPRLLLGLDYDGTLVPIAARPEEAQPTADILDLLSHLAHVPDVEVIVVSGRPLADLCTLLPLPGISYVGTHGLEVCTATGKQTTLLPAGAFSAMLTLLRLEVEALVGGTPGILMEDKGQTLALHYRLAQPEVGAQVVSRFLTLVRGYRAKGVALEVLHGKKVVEVRPVGVNKGKALQLFLQTCHRQTLPLYIGDDVTDEDAFRVLQDRGVTIVVADPPRQTAAQYYLRNPQEVARFLRRLLQARRAEATLS